MSKQGTELNLAEELAEHLRLANVEGLPKEWFETTSPVAVSPATDLSQEVVPAEAVEQSVVPSQQFEQDSRTEEFSAFSLKELEQRALSCRDCRLCETRNNVVFGVGNTERPMIAFVGEGPGADEDRLGEPFVGKAGELLTAAITKGLGLRREDLYICNVVKCRPPNNRNPLPDEVAACVHYLHRQLQLIQPKVIVTLGAPAQKALSGVEMGITKLRGNWQEWRGIPLMPTFHPAYILRNASAKRPFWEDLQDVMKRLDIQESS